MLLNDIICQQKRAGALAIFDAKRCYNRINHTFAILVLIGFGLCWLHAKVLFEVLQIAEHRIKTGFGASEPAYGLEDDEPLMGVGQGKGNGCCVWTLISSNMIETMKKRSHAAYF